MYAATSDADVYRRIKTQSKAAVTMWAWITARIVIRTVAAPLTPGDLFFRKTCCTTGGPSDPLPPPLLAHQESTHDLPLGLAKIEKRFQFENVFWSVLG